MVDLIAFFWAERYQFLWEGNAVPAALGVFGKMGLCQHLGRSLDSTRHYTSLTE